MQSLKINEKFQKNEGIKDHSSFFNFNKRTIMVSQYSYILLLNMQVKSQKPLLSSTFKVLRQLQQNESLRIEIFRLRSQMRDQHHHFLNQIVNHEMLIQKMITELSLACRRGKEGKKEESNVFSGVVDRCIDDLESLLNSYEQLRGDWSKQKPQSSEIYCEKVLRDFSSRFDKAQEVIDELNRQRQKSIKEISSKTVKIESMQAELQKLKQRYEQRVKQLSFLRVENSKLSESLSESQIKVNCYTQQMSKLRSNNDTLSYSLKESREVSNRHTEYLSKKCEGIEKQNKQLIDMQKEANLKQQKLTRTITQNQRQILRLTSEVHRLTKELIHYKTQFKEIIDKENKIRHLEKTFNKIINQKVVLEDASNQNIPNNEQAVIDRPFRKEVGKMINKKFNLQSFQEKLTTNNQSALFFPH